MPHIINAALILLGNRVDFSVCNDIKTYPASTGCPILKTVEH